MPLDLQPVQEDEASSQLDLQPIGEASSSAQPEEEGKGFLPTPNDIKRGVGPIQDARRGIRAIAVGAENLILHPTEGGNAVLRANEALKPGYKPVKGEKLATFAAGMADPLNLAVTAAFPEARFMSSVKGGGAAVAVDDVLKQAEETGRIKPGEVALSLMVGGAAGIGAHVVSNGLSGFVESSGSILKGLANIPRKATQLLTDNPDLQKLWKGTPEEVKMLVRGVQDNLNELRTGAKMYYDDAIGKLGLGKTSEQKVFSRPLKPQDIPSQFKQYVMIKGRLKPTDRFKILLQQRQSIDHYVEYRTGVVKPTLEGGGMLTAEQKDGLLAYRKNINDEVEKVPGGEVLRDADHVLHRAATIFSDLQQHLSKPGGAEQFLRNTFEKDTPESHDNLISLMALEKETGKPVVQNLFKSLTSEWFNRKLYADRIRSAFGGISAFIVSRALAIPYAAAVGLAVAAQSPTLLGKVLRTTAGSANFVARGLREASTTNLLAAESAVENQPLLQGSDGQE